MANLIADNILDIKIAFTEKETSFGMYHEKMGIISDDSGNSVAFSGSLNETLNALSFNYETIDVYCSWKTEDAERVNDKKEAFERIWNDIESNIKIISFPELSLDEKYNVLLSADGAKLPQGDDIETSTAQSISIIFAFIAGVIKMAKENQNSDDRIAQTEPYPLVMDAPLSAFDKKRINTVCDVLPNIAEQVIIFIKDTDGELAENYLDPKVGKRYKFAKKTEFETDLTEVG